MCDMARARESHLFVLTWDLSYVLHLHVLKCDHNVEVNVMSFVFVLKCIEINARLGLLLDMDLSLQQR